MCGKKHLHTTYLFHRDRLSDTALVDSDTAKIQENTMLSKNVELIEYSKKVDKANCATHATGAVLAIFGLVALIMKAEGVRHTLSAVIYGISLIAVYAVSAAYHGLPQGETKRKARQIDHSTVPVLIAGTATPCALVTLYDIGVANCLVVLILGWLCALFGIFSKLFFFEKLKAVTMAVYITSGAVMLMSALPVLDKIHTGAFRQLVIGCFIYVIGAVFCGLGKKREWLHVVFHLFVMAASAFHFYVIYRFVL